MKLGIPKERNDRRVALVPATLPKIKDLGLEILVEQGAGIESSFADADYDAHAQLVTRQELFAQADMILSVNPLSDEEYQSLKQETLVISMFQPYVDATITDKLRGWNLRGFSFDMIPRTTLAQSMDVLSSMAAVAGYKAVLEAASHLPRYFPMMITAAGSIPPSKVLVLGAGVAGLQAIATARRLGAQVEAFDTRAAAKEEVESLGARFVEVAGAKDDKGAGGYAVEQSEEYLRRQREEVQIRAAKADVIITTAQVRGRKAPILLPKETVEKMKSGSVVVDLAASTGGNCELTQDNQIIQYHGVTIIGNSYLAAQMPQDSSFLFSTNALNFFKMLIKKGGELNLDMNNEIIRGAHFTAQPVEA